ncbi:MAG: 2-dehydropantoate 2-reductase, partial [Opitutales bacterium]|nr:2-dehydropantoate 2-reductase [Opitutales bacterium]
MKSQTVGKIGLVGPGAVGGYYGGLLALSGQDIHFHF